MPTSLAVGAEDVDLVTVGESWVTENQGNFLWPRLPRVLCLPRRTGHGTVNYKLPALDNFMLKGNLGDWEPGQAKRASRAPGSVDATFTPRGRDVVPMDRPLNRPRPHRYRDLETNIVPGQLGELWQGMDKDVVTILGTVANWDGGAYKTFTGGGSALDVPNATQQPLRDIITDTQPQRKYAARAGYKYIAIMDFHVAVTFAGHPDFTGAGTGSAIASMITLAEMEARFRALLMVDEVWIVGEVSDTVEEGIASSINHLTNGLLFFGVFDFRASQYDLRDRESNDAPDGALCLALADMPAVRATQDIRHQVEYFDAEVSYDAYQPRSAGAASPFGMVYQPTGANGIFTALPS